MQTFREHLFRALVISASLAVAACGGGGGGGGGTPPPPPVVTVSVSPPTASVPLGGTSQFNATVTGTTNTGVNWSVNNVAGGNSTVGTISAGGLYTAPQNLPSPAGVTVTATSQASPTSSGSASVTVTSDVAVSVSPSNPSVELGATRQFTATVTGSGNPNTAVNWSVSGSVCTGAACGTINSTGLYTAPQIKPAGTVTVTATSQADPSKNGSTGVTLASSFTFTVQGPDQVVNAAQGQYTAEFTVPSGSNPDRGVTWSVSGAGCTGAACGTIDGTGLYTAPTLAPNPAQVTITATSIADPSKQATKSVTILVEVVVTVSPQSVSVNLEAQQQFTATVGGTTNQNVTWDVNGIAGGNTTVGTITQAGLYTAPVNRPTPDTLTIRAVSQQDTAKSGTATVTLTSQIAVTVSPSAATRAVNRRATFLGQASNTSNNSLTWAVNGDPDGNTTVGRICVKNSNPCQPISVIASGEVEYQAPAAVPSPATVSITATSQADPQRQGEAFVTIVANVFVSVSPASVTLPPNQTQQFSATVVGTDNQGVTWSVSGPGCTGNACGTITTGGLYTSPADAPSPNEITVTAASIEDPAQTSTASVTIATGAFIRLIQPASVFGGGTFSFTLKVTGFNFKSSTPGPGSVIVFSGAEKTGTICPNESECTAFLTSDDVAAAGTKTVQIKNPPTLQNPNPSFSNQVDFVVVQPATTEDTVALTSGAPSATGRDVVVTEPTSAGTGSPQINATLIGIAPDVGNCSARGSSVRIERPTSGTRNVRICFVVDNSVGTLTISISGPTPNDITLQDQTTGFVTLVISSTSQPGARTLFFEDSNKNKSAMVGAIEVK